MAATKTVYQLPLFHNSLTPRRGVVTLFGYGIRVSQDRGHLLLEDGIGADRHTIRLPRVGHGLKRLVIIGSNGFVSLAALRWLADQRAAFIMLERDGKVLAVTGPVRPSDSRLRRAQALAHSSGAALPIARELITQKLAGQEQVARNKLLDCTTADAIARFRAEVATAESISKLRLLESQGAAAYWSAWHTLPINFPRNDLRLGVPAHWQVFGARMSPLTKSPRLASNPPNAILNYLYALLESEARLAAAALGLDPGLGVLHADGPVRDSLACDLMEPVRPKIDAYVLDWITREPLRREWFFEQRDGNCRLMGPFAVRLSETAPTWGRAVAPFAEWIARALWSTTLKPARRAVPASRLTQRHRREAKGSMSLPINRGPRPESVCRICGTSIESGRTYCALCGVTVSKENLVELAKRGRVTAQSPEAQARRTETKRRHDVARRGWLPSSQPAWLNNETYTNKIQPGLAAITVPAIASAIGVSTPYATDIRAGRRRPHPRHWGALAGLIGLSAAGQ